MQRYVCRIYISQSYIHTQDYTRGSTHSSFLEHFLQRRNTTTIESVGKSVLSAKQLCFTQSAHTQTTFSSPESCQMALDSYVRGPYGPTSQRQEPNQEAVQGQETQEVDVLLTQHGNPMSIPAQNGPYLVYPNTPDPAISSPTPAAPNPKGDKKGPITTSRTMTSSTRASKGRQAIDKSTVPKLTAPLSELTKIYEHIPIKDMEAWSTRPLEERVLERGKGGRVRRPMNSFMLYRAAYAERCQVWCARNDRQTTSTICGASWKLEPPEIKEYYINCATVEARNHLNAHPDYCYNPPHNLERKRKRAALEDEDEAEPSNPHDPEHPPSAV